MGKERAVSKSIYNESLPSFLHLLRCLLCRSMGIDTKSLFHLISKSVMCGICLLSLDLCFINTRMKILWS